MQHPPFKLNGLEKMGHLDLVNLFLFLLKPFSKAKIGLKK